MPEERPQEEDDGLVIRPPETIKTGRQPREPVDKPATLDERLQAKARLLSDRLFERRQELGKTLGDPLKSEKLSPTERKQQYTDLISSNEMLMSALAGAAVVGRDGRLRLSTKMVDAFIELSDR